METLKSLQAGDFAGAKRFSLSADLTEFPTEIFDLADSLEVLDLSNNHLSSLPDDFGRLQNLKAVFFVNNDFEEIPEVLTQCPHLDIFGFKANKIKAINPKALPVHLRWLILTDNNLEALPPEMGSLNKLQKLMLAGNRLTALPPEMVGCSSLELIRLASNRLTELPRWLLTLPRLSWLAYAGNPFCAENSMPSSPLPDICWADLALEEVLGQGASGVISKAVWRQSSQAPKTVAVKIFKGDMTSDGSPMDERQACILAGNHPNLVTLIGNLAQHPEGKAGLILSLIPSNYQNLAGPPSLETCTRDTYGADTTFSWSMLLNMAQGIASVAAHLHKRGILHGDLYPHNTLIDEAGHSLFGDFGAASLYDTDDTELSKALEQLEVRAFGCFLEDLLDRCDPQDASIHTTEFAQLRQIQHTCMDPDPAQRPFFAEITQYLAQLAEL